MNGNIDKIDESQLGKLIRVHKTSVWNYWWAILLALLLLLIPAIVVGVPGSAISSKATIWDKDTTTGVLVWSIFGSLGMLPIIGLFYQLKNEARFYEEGIVYENRRWIKVAQWAEVRDVWEWCARVNAQGLPLPSQLFFAIRTVDGMRIRFSPRLNNIEELGKFLRSEAVKWGVPIREGVPPMKNNLMSLMGKKS